MHRFVLTFAVLTLTAGFTWSETFYSKITKVEGNKITYHKIILGKPGKIFDAATTETVKDVVVKQLVLSKKNIEPLKDGLADPIFKDIGDKGLRATIVTADVGENIGKIVEIIVRKTQ